MSVLIFPIECAEVDDSKTKPSLFAAPQPQEESDSRELRWQVSELREARYQQRFEKQTGAMGVARPELEQGTFSLLSCMGTQTAAPSLL